MTIFVCDENFEGLLLKQLSNIQESIANYSHHAVYFLCILVPGLNTEILALEVLSNFIL